MTNLSSQFPNIDDINRSPLCQDGATPRYPTPRELTKPESAQAWVAVVDRELSRYQRPLVRWDAIVAGTCGSVPATATIGGLSIWVATRLAGQKESLWTLLAAAAVIAAIPTLIMLYAFPAMIDKVDQRLNKRVKNSREVAGRVNHLLELKKGYLVRAELLKAGLGPKPEPDKSQHARTVQPVEVSRKGSNAGGTNPPLD